MDSSFSTPVKEEEKEVASIVDPFLKEALQNPRHRLTILRMELDIQSFIQNQDQQLFEFPHYPTSYLRLAAHRVAQHYGLQSMVTENSIDGLRTRIIVKKTPETNFPSLRLSDIPTEEEQQPPEKVKIAIKQRSQTTSNGSNGAGSKLKRSKTMEERTEEYERARARIFNTGHQDVSYTDEDSNVNRVAIFRDREKDRSDPDYDRSYERYVRGSYIVQPAVFGYPPQHGAASVNYSPSFCAVGLNQSYVQCPSLTMMYTQHSYEQVRHAVFQAPFYHHQQLSLDYAQNY